MSDAEIHEYSEYKKKNADEEGIKEATRATHVPSVPFISKALITPQSPPAINTKKGTAAHIRLK